jgi:hypothetical protein
MNCTAFKKSLSQYLSGELSEDKRLECESHSQECTACRDLEENHRKLDEVLLDAAELDVSEEELRGMEAEVWGRWVGTKRNAPREGFFSRFRTAPALNVLALCALVLMFLYSPGLLRQTETSPVSASPSLPYPEPQMFADEEKQRMFDEFQALFGPQLNWVAENTQQVSLGIYDKPVTDLPEVAVQGPALALGYWLVPADGQKGVILPDPTFVLTRPGQQVNVRGIWSSGGLSMDIAVTSIIPAPRGVAIGTRVTLVSRNGRVRSGEGEPSASVATCVTVAPGQTIKLGQMMTGRGLYDVFLSLRVLQKGNNETASFS